jgi:hypothetical protein
VRWLRRKNFLLKRGMFDERMDVRRKTRKKKSLKNDRQIKNEGLLSHNKTDEVASWIAVRRDIKRSVTGTSPIEANTGMCIYMCASVY